MTYVRELLRRHYDHLEREHAKISEEEASRTRVEAENVLYLANLVDTGMPTEELLRLVRSYDAYNH